MSSQISFIHIPKNAGSSIKSMIARNQLPGVRYYGHRVDPAKVAGDHIVILRDPYERFASAVRYAIQLYSHESQIKAIIDAGYTDPNSWAEALADPEHPGHELVLGEVVNPSRHMIGNSILEWKWTYTSQAAWFDRSNPTYVLMMDTLDDDFNNLMENLGYSDLKVPVANRTKKSSTIDEFSEKAKAFIEEMYKRDFEILNEYRQKRLDTKTK